VGEFEAFGLGIDQNPRDGTGNRSKAKQSNAEGALKAGVSC
jgi:hypothetical protein